MSEQASNSPPPIPNADEPPEITPRPNWYYVENGVKNGPISATAINDLLNKKKIEAGTQVWRKGDERTEERKFAMKVLTVLPILFSIFSLQAKADDDERMNEFWKNASRPIHSD